MCTFQKIKQNFTNVIIYRLLLLNERVQQNGEAGKVGEKCSETENLFRHSLERLPAAYLTTMKRSLRTTELAVIGELQNGSMKRLEEGPRKPYRTGYYQACAKAYAERRHEGSEKSRTGECFT